MTSFFLYFALLFSVRGVVVDPSARPIEGARVSCGDAVTRTDDRGQFTLEAPAECELTIAKIGFIGATQPASNVEVKIELSLAPRSERVVVSATRSPILLEEAGVSASVLTEQELAQRQYPMVLDLLREIPGMNISKYSRAGGLTSVFTRGGSSNSTLFLLDGVPLNEPGGQIDLAHIQSEGLERIEAVRGPGSVVCGAEASAGVVQLFSKCGDVEAKIPHGFLSYERGSFQTDRWSAGIDGGLFGRFDYALSAQQFHTVSEFQNDFYRNTTGTANVGFRITDATRLRAVFREYDSHVGTPDQVGYGVFDNDANATARDSAFSLKLDDARGKRFFQRAMFNYHRLSSGFFDQNIDGPYTIAALLKTVTDSRKYVYLVALVDPRTTVAPPGLTLVTQTTSLYPFPSDFFTNRASFDYQGTVTHKGGSLTGGYRFENQGGTISAVDVSRRNNGAFLHEQYAVTPRLSLTAGARVEHSTTFGSRFVPRGSASYQLFGEHGRFSSTWIHASAGRGYREPTLLENFAKESFYVGNPALRPEKTTSFEGGVSQEWLAHRVRADMTYFRNSFEDLIAFIFASPQSTFTNIQRSWARGMESSLKARVNRHVSFTGAYTLLYTRVTQSSSPRSNITGDGYELVLRPRNSGSVSTTITGKRWVVVAGARFVGERQDSGMFGENRNPGYTSAFGNASLQATKHFAPFIRIENLANERYQEVLGYSSLARQILGGVRATW